MGIKKRTLYWCIGIIVLVFLILTVQGYFTENINDSETQISGDVEKIEIIHFHGTNQCYSCVTVGDMAEETVNTYFSNELALGKITFAHLNGELEKNKEKVIKYGATGSSLWIGTYYKDESFRKEENINVWYKINNKQDYMNYLKDIIEKKLSGE